MELLSILSYNLFSPTVMFFVLGVMAGLLKSDLKSLKVEFNSMKNELTAVLKARTLNLFHVVLYSIIVLGFISSVYTLFR